MLDQCLGLSKALNVIHGNDESSPSYNDEAKYGIHSDIKPKNILWFRRSSSNLGTLQLADFGSTTFHSEETKSNNKIYAHTKTYAPPEVVCAEDTSRAFDIWGLGCVFLEFLSCLVLGSENCPKTFATARSNATTAFQCRPEFQTPSSPITFDTFYSSATPKSNSAGRSAVSVVVNEAVNEVKFPFTAVCLDHLF